MNVKVIRMWSGEDVVTDLLEVKEDSIVITNPLVAVPTRDGQMGFAPWAPLLPQKNHEIEVSRKYVVYISETQEPIEKEYNNMFSAIQTPSKSLIL
mgnify:CR=1 FL=1|tara:strand:+ start:153 stop:440 length:288 start_codon:yes stop_codon:yes gene_type:complete